jgi:hypothetical protein
MVVYRCSVLTVMNQKDRILILESRADSVSTLSRVHSAETTGQSTNPMTARAGAPEMISTMLKPAIEKLTAELPRE